MVLIRRLLSCSNFSRFDVRRPRKIHIREYQSVSVGDVALSKGYTCAFSNRDQIRDGIVGSPYPEVHIPNMTLDEFLLSQVENWLDRVAVECSVRRKTYTFEQLLNLSGRFAVSLRKEGLQPGDVMSVLLPNTPEFAVVLLGALRAGLIVSPNSAIHTPYEMTHYLGDSGSKVVVTSVDVDPKLEQVKRELELKTNRAYSPKKIFIKLDPSDELPADALSFEDMVSDQVSDCEIPASRRAEDVAIYSYSSGTTGLPKAVQLTHRNLISNILQTAEEKVGCLRTTTKDYQERLVAYLPLYHVYGLAIILMRSIFHGCRVMTMPKFETQRFISVLQNHRPTVLHTVPPTVLWLGSNELVTGDNLASVNYIVCGGAPHKPEDNERVLQKLKKDVVFSQVYGATEVGPLALVSYSDKNEFSSLFPLSNTTIKLVKSDGSLARPNEEGEIYIKGPQVMKGYLNMAEATKKAVDDDQFYHSGDIGTYNEDGAFTITDRIKELIKVKGFQVSPSELESVLRSHPCVLDTAVIGVPDIRSGEKPIAFVVKKNTKVDEETLKAFVAQKLSPYKRLAAVHFVDTIPKNLSGKILRRVLKEEYMKKQS